MKVKLIVILLLQALTMSAWDWWPLPTAEPDTCRDSIRYNVTLSAMGGYGHYSAFWMQSEENGIVSSSANSGSLRVGVFKNATRPNRWFDYDMAVDLIGSVHSALPYNWSLLSHGKFPVYQGKYGNMIIHQCYAHVRLYIIDITAGVKPLSDGMDTPLGTGSLLLSANAPSMPQIRIGLDHWTPFPGLYGYLEIKGGIVHTWMTDNVIIKSTKLHYKFAGVQIGGSLPVNISYELHHTAQWGGISVDGTDLGNSFSSFTRVFFAKPGDSSYNELYNAQGNHLGSQQLALTVKGKEWSVKTYWQNILEDNFALIGQGHNLPDGRWGISVQQEKWSFINKLTMEYVGTTDQSGPMHDQDGIIYAGNDEYYCNGIYRQGWNYYLRSLGTPLITSPIYNDDGYLQTRNNRIKAYHIGIGGDIYGFRYRLIATYIRNFGSYSQGDWYRERNHNTALLLEIKKNVEKLWGLDFGLRLATDVGTQWGNQSGVMLSISKQGIITQY